MAKKFDRKEPNIDNPFFRRSISNSLRIRMFRPSKEERALPKVETKHATGVSTLLIALHLSMLIVGAQYSSEEDCKLEASEYMYDEFHLGLK